MSAVSIESMKANKPIVILFNQITETFLATVEGNGWILPSGVPTGVVDFYMSASPFNLQYGKTSAKVKTFLDSIANAGRAYSMPPYGDVLPILATHRLSADSAIPYKMGPDEFIVGRSNGTWNEICKWLSECGVDGAVDVIGKGSQFMSNAHAYIRTKGDSITEDGWKTDVLVPSFGADWRERSENLSKNKFLRLFGASDALLDAFNKAVIVNNNKPVELAHESRFVANFIALFKPTTEFKVGAVSDIINFAAMTSGELAPKNPTDQDSLKMMQRFEEKSEVISNIVCAFFDMEPDDVGVLTFVKKYMPFASVTRVYPTAELAMAAEDFLAGKITFNSDDQILIDSLLTNARALTQVYLRK